MPEFLYTSPRTKQVYKWTPDDASYEPSEKAMQDIALKVEQIETDSEQSALGAFGSAVGQGLATMPGTVLQGVGAMVGSTGLEEAGRYSAGQAREAFPIDPMRREDLTTKAGQAVGQAIGQLGLAVGTGGGSLGTGLVLGTAAAMGAASGSDRAEQSGLTGARRMGRVYGSALTELASERLFGLGSKTFFKPAAIPTTFGQKGLRFAGTSAGEGVEEIAAGVGNNIVDNVTAAGLDIPTPDIVGMNAFKSYAEQGLLGMVGGTVFAGAQLALGSQAAATPVTRAYATVDGVRMDVTDLSPTQRKDLGIDEATVEYESILPTEDADIASGIQNKNVRDMFTEMKTNADAKSLDDALNLGAASSVLATAMGAGTPAAAVTPAPTQAPIVSTPEEAMTSTGAPTPVGAPAAAAADITEFPAEGPTNLVDLSNLRFTGTPTQTPTFNATLQGDFTENRVEERVQTGPGGTPTEAGRGDSTVERRKVEQAVAEDETVAPPPAVEAAPAAVESTGKNMGAVFSAQPKRKYENVADAVKKIQKAGTGTTPAAAAAAPAAPTEIPVPQAPASPQAIVNSIPEITATITGETTGTGSTVPAETISLQSGGEPTVSLPAAESPMTRVSGGLGSVVPSASERAARIAKYKVGSRQSAYDLATIAKTEGVDLSTMSREEYVAYAKKQGIRLSDQTLREQAILRMASSVTEATQMRKSMAPQTLEEEQADKKFASFADWVKKAAEGKGVTNNGEVAPGVAVRSGTKDSFSWLFFGIGKGAGTDASGLTHKSYIGFTNHYKSLTPRRFIDFMSALKDAGYNGDVKSMQDLMSQSSLQDQIVMHGNTEADAQLALQVAKSFFGPELSFTDIGVDNTNIGSHSEILAKTLSDELAAESSAPAAAEAAPAATAAAPAAAAPTGAPAAAAPAAAAPAAAAPAAAEATVTEEALPEEPEAVDPNSYKTGDSKDIFVEPTKKGFFSQFIGEENPYSPKEKQSDLELRDNFVRKYLVDGRVPTTQSNTDKMYELIDTLRSRQRLEAQREQNIEIDPTYGNYDAVPAVQLAEIYLYASRLNDGGKMLRHLQSIGSLFYYSYGGQGRSAARGLNAISHFVRRINIAKAYDIHRKGQSKNAAKNIGVDENDLADFQGYIDGVIPSAEDLSQGLGAAVVNTGVPGEATVSVDDVVANQLRTQPALPVTPASEPLVTEADIAPQVAAEAASAAEAKAEERAQTESRGLDPETNTEIGDTIYTANPEPKSPNAPKVTPAQARIIVTQTLGFTPKNVAFEDTDVPNEDGDQYAGKVNKSTKQITINLRNINDSTHLKDVLFEEMDHLVYADPMVQAEIALLAENLPEDIRQEVRQYRPEFQREEATIRFMRRLEQEPNTASLWKKFVDAVRAAIRRLFNGQLTTRDLKMAADRVAARSFQAMAAQTFLAGKSGTSYSLAPKSPEAIRHGELEAKFNAGTITPQEEAEAKQLVQQRAQANSYNRKGVRFGFYVNGVPLPPSRAANLNFGPGYYVAEDASLDVKASNVSVSKKLNLVELKRLGLDPESVEYREDSVFVKAATPYRSEYGSNATPETKAFIDATFAYESAIQEANRRLGLPTEPTNYGTVIADLIAQERIPFDSTQGMTGRKGMTSELVVQNASQIKSAQTFNGIFLDERFDSRKDDIRYSVPNPNQPAPEAPDLGPNIFTEETSSLAATPAKLRAKIKTQPAPNVAKAKADPNIEFTKSFIAAWDRASGKEKADAKPKEKIPAKEVISEFTSLPKKGKGYALTDTGRDAFLTALNQKLVDLGVPSDLAFEATRRAWATYSTKKQKNIDAKALAAAKRDIREQQRLAKKTADQAQAALDKPTNTAKDYLKPAAAPKGPAVQDPVRKALRDAEKIPRIGAAFNSSPEARNAFMTGLSSKLISLGVDQQTAWAAANKAWSTYQTNLADKVTALRKDIENNKMSAILARELKKIPVYQQNDIQYVREYMKNILVFGGLAEDVADAAATLYINKYVDLMKQTKVKAAEKFIESESGAKIKKKIATKPTEYDKLMEAVRLGVTDQSFTAALAFTAPSKFQAFTQADHDRMVALEEEIQDPDTPNLIKVQKVNELMKLADSRMNDINALNVFTGYLVNNTLSGIGTAAIQVFTPFYSMTTRLATDGVRGLLSLDPQRFIASMYAVMDAADTVTAEFKYSFGNDVFRRGQQAELRTLTDLRKVLDNNLKIYQTTTNGLEKTVAASKIALAAPDYVRRLYSAMDTASQSLFINQIKVVGIYDAMKKNGMSLKKFKDMLDAKRTFRDAYTITLHGQGGYTKDQIRLIAEDAAMNDFGEQVAAAIGQGGAETIADVYKMAELEGPSEIGVAESVDGHVIPFLLDVLDSIKSSGDRAAGQGAGDLAFRLVVGYPTTALKVLNRSLYFFPPTAVARMILNKRYENQADFDPEAPRKYEMLRTESQKQQRFAEFVTGSFATFILMALIMDERDKEEKDRRFAVHNLGPSDRAAKQAWRAAGNVAQSIQWRTSETSPWVSISWAKAGLESLAPVLALVGTVYDSRDEIVDEGKMADHALNVAGGVMGVFNRPLSGLNDIGEILSGEKNSISQKSLASYTAFRASGLVPFSSLLKTYNRTQGPRDLSTATSTMMAQIPIAGPSLTEPGINLFGDPLGATPNELTYKLPILPVQVGLRQQDVPFYEKILSKGQYPPLKLRTTFEKTYGPVTDSVWRQYVEKRGQMVKKLIIDRWTDLDTLSPEIYDKVLGKFAEAADETVIQELKIQRVPKPVIK